MARGQPAGPRTRSPDRADRQGRPGNGPNEFRTWVEIRLEPGPVFGLNHRVPVLSKLSARIAVGLDRLLAAVPGSLGICAKEPGMVATKR